MRRIAPLLLAALALPAQAQTPPPWQASRWNPAAQPDDLVLPIPCGGSIALRQVAVPSGSGPLDDQRVQLGSPEPEIGYSEFLRNAYIAAGFQSGPQERHFWIGKYEVTQDQYAAVMNPEKCPEATPRSRRPVAEISWFDAVAFTRALTSWILANAKARMPGQDGATGFLRLPTEDEWEFAARGGSKVSESDFLAPAFPMPDGEPEDYIMAGASRTGNQAQAVGQLKPNPLGLHDMLGNVAEMVLEPYRLNRVGRPHGQAGGVIIKGGDYAKQAEDLRSSARDELPPFAADGQPTRLPTVGFRVALSVVATTSLPQAERLRQAFAAESTSRAAEARGAAEDPQRALALLRQRSPDPALQAALQRVEAQIASGERARADQQREVARAQIESMAALALALDAGNRQADGAQRQIDIIRPLASDAPAQPGQSRLTTAELQAMEASVRDMRRQVTSFAESYAGTMRRVAETLNRAGAVEQLGLVRRQLTERNQPLLLRFLDGVDKHLRDTALGRAPNAQQISADVIAAAEAARQRR